MKKNKMMRLASVMMVMTLMTTSVISGTFAKYTTQDSGSDVARVAKWGVELQVVGDLYGEQYLNVGKGNLATAGDNNLSVQTSQVGTNVVAPGTKNTGNGFSFFLKGEPEVESKVKVDVFAQNIYLKAGDYGTLVLVPAGTVTEANYETLQPNLYVESTTVAGAYELAATTMDISVTNYYTVEDVADVQNDYYPVVYTLNGNTSNEGSIATDSLNEAAIKILKAVVVDDATVVLTPSADAALYSGSVEETYAVNTKFSNLNINNTNLTWEWAFGGAEEGDDAAETDLADTILGNLIADTATDTYKIVKYNDTKKVYETVSVTPVDVADDAGYKDYTVAKVGTETVACLTTQFAIDITVTQVD